MTPTGPVATAPNSASNGIAQRFEVESIDGVIKLYIDDVLKITYAMMADELTKFGAKTKTGLRLQKSGTPTFDALADGYRIDKL